MSKSKIQNIVYFAKNRLSMLFEPVIGYTRVVSATKFILSFIAFIMVLMIVLIPFFNPVQDNFRITFSSINGNEEIEDPKMINHRFQGIDKDDQTYNISAKEAIKKQNKTLILKDINADINLKDGTWVALMADKGTFNHKDSSLILENSVSLFTNNGYEFYTKDIEVDIKNNSAYGYSKVHGNGPIGSVSADSFKALDKGEKTIFTGNVVVTLHNEVKKHIPKQDH